MQANFKLEFKSTTKQCGNLICSKSVDFGIKQNMQHFNCYSVIMFENSALYGFILTFHLSKLIIATT